MFSNPSHNAEGGGRYGILGKTAIPELLTGRNTIYVKAVVYGRRHGLNCIPLLVIMPSRSAWLTDAVNFH